MKSWGYLGLAMAMAFAVVVTVGPTPVDAAQNCPGSGSGGVGGLPLDESKKANLDGDGPNNDLVEVFYDQSTSTGRIRVTLDNGYRAVTDDLFVVFAINIGRIVDVDQDGDDEIFIIKLEGPLFQQVQPYVFAGCDLVIPQHGGSDFFGLFGGSGGGGFNGFDCFAPSQGGKGVTTYSTAFNMVPPESYTSERKEYKLVVNDNTGNARVVLEHQSTITWPEGKMQSVSEWRARFNCSPAPKCDGKRATIQGTPAKDVINGTGKKDIVAARAGNDVIKSLGGNDIICAGDGNDKVEGGKGGDVMFGEAGKDTLLGGAGSDKAFGGPGADTCTAEVKKSC